VLVGGVVGTVGCYGVVHEKLFSHSATVLCVPKKKTANKKNILILGNFFSRQEVPA